ncbi:hypothetical protein CEXT_710801 [Caerostris extrusa]|uniref:Uncharacterized protein n=1 Tax=Caerostris extrusa TaxID=172846 RepID=A0AAV4TJP7_CAEEX|nr:hypothetical protein CEXT_710801 [Caerostris extrusa]
MYGSMLFTFSPFFMEKGGQGSCRHVEWRGRLNEMSFLSSAGVRLLTGGYGGWCGMGAKMDGMRLWVCWDLGWNLNNST